MRTAPQPWGPWSAPLTIFNGIRDKGTCYFIHNDGPCPASAPNPGQVGIQGGGYGPYFISGWTTGELAAQTAPANSTFCFTLDTFNSYAEVILKSTIKG